MRRVEDDDIFVRQVGASWVSTQVSKMRRFMGRSTTKGAVRPW